MHPLPKNKFFRLRGSYLWPVLWSFGPLVLCPGSRSFVLAPVLCPGSGPPVLRSLAPLAGPLDLCPPLALPWPYLDDTLTIDD